MGNKLRINKENPNKEVIETKDMPLAKAEVTGPETKNGIIVNSLNVNMRSGPSFESGVFGTLRNGDKVTIIGRENGFYRILTSNNITAYIFSDFVKEE